MAEKKYWLHRISHWGGVSFPLLEQGYLTIGFSDFIGAEGFLDSVLAQNKEAFEMANMKVWTIKKRNRWTLWRFIAEFNVGDRVIVPESKKFSVYKILEKAKEISSLRNVEITDRSGNPIFFKDDKLYYNNQLVDLGFVIKVEKVEVDIPREEYAENSLVARMKIRQTNCDITDLHKVIEKALKAYEIKKPISLYAQATDNMAVTLLESIKKITPSRFEKLIKWYFYKIGANDVLIPPKKNSAKLPGADVDIVAEFDTLKFVFYVQAKQHNGYTSKWAIDQITQYVNNREKEDGVTYILWVITTAEFNSEVRSYAKNDNVRLIDGIEFSKMLIDTGLKDIDSAFL